MLSRLQSISSVNYHIQQVQDYGYPTYVTQLGPHAVQITNAQLQVYNKSGSGLDLYVLGFYVHNLKTTAGAGLDTYGYLGVVSTEATGTESNIVNVNTWTADVATSLIAQIDQPTNAPGASVFQYYGFNTSSVDNAAAAGSAGAWGRNLLANVRGQRPMILQPGQGIQVAYGVADTNSLLWHQLVFGVVPH